MKAAIIAVLSALSLGLSGCSTKSGADRAPEATARVTRASAAESVGVTEKERARLISESLVGGVDDVTEAYAVITGNTAIVGVALTGGADEFAVRRECEKFVKACDGLIDHVSVTTAPALVERVKRHYPAQ